MAALELALRLAHILAAVALGGALFYQLIALHPVLRTVDETQRATLRNQLAQRWAGVVFAGIGLLFVSGLVNFLLFKIPEYREVPFKGLYHGLFGLKLLAALALFHVALVLTLPGSRGDRYRAKAGFWLQYGGVLLVIIIVLGGVLRTLPHFYA